MNGFLTLAGKRAFVTSGTKGAGAAILVGHSCGGMIVTEAGNARSSS